MKNLAIHPNQWRTFCEAFSTLNRGTLITAEMHHLDNRRDEIARDAMFQTMSFDKTDACNDIITIDFGQEGEMQRSHVVIEPIHLRIKENGDGKKRLQIEAENGVTLLTFHSGRFPVSDFESEFSNFRQGALKEAISS